MKSLLDTITAISTPPGHGGIGIVRLSGLESVEIAKKIFSQTGKEKRIKSHYLMHGYIIDPSNKEKVDEVLLTVMISPKTYTGEDTVEISCHGGFYNTNKILNITIQAGARLAEPGEFTKRAFLNGRINLLQAEGVIDLINSKTEIAHEAAFKLLDNSLSQRVEELKKRLFSIAVEVESEIDFSEEDIDIKGEGAWLKDLKEIVESINTLTGSYRRGKIVRNGIRIAIAGKPNVGKSSLMNALLKEDRAIVSNIPGTTRDSIEESLSLNGLSITLTDTAGIQNSKDCIEKEGIRRSRLVVESADMLLVVFDGTQKICENDQRILDLVSGSPKHLLFVVNKADKEQLLSSSCFDPDNIYPAFHVSAKTGEGIEELVKGISREILEGKGACQSEEKLLITGKRQYDLLVRTQIALKRGVDVLENKMSVDMFAEEIKEGISILAELMGETYSDEILGRIFSEFCIGK